MTIAEYSVDSMRHRHVRVLAVVVCVIVGVDVAQVFAQTCPIDAPANCQFPGDSLEFRYAKRYTTSPKDDFRPSSDTLSSLCVWGRYAKLVADENGQRQFADCGASYGTQEFEVSILHSDADGLPTGDPPPATQIVSSFDMAYVPATAAEAASGIRTYAYHLPLVEPVTGLDASGATCYWLSVRSIQGFATGDTGCIWYWQMADPVHNDFMAEAGLIRERYGDMAFCLDCGIEPDGCGVPTGYCCACDGSCRDVSFRDCRATDDDWHIGATCAEAGPGACRGTPPDYDSCLAVADSAYPSQVLDRTAYFDNFCATTDGVTPVRTDRQDGVEIEGDVWLKYDNVDGCDHLAIYSEFRPVDGGGLDSVLTVYHDPEHPQTCVCPSTATEHERLLSWSCHPEARVVNDDASASFACGGAARLEMTQGGCYMIRVAGKQGAEHAHGRSWVYAYSSCVDHFQPPPVPDVSNPAKNRYLSFSIPSESSGGTVRVRAVSIPSHPELAGTEFWVGQPHLVPDEDSSDPSRTILVAPLACEPYYDDWSRFGVVHVYGAEIVPGAEYEVQSSCCSETSWPCFSSPASIVTGTFGDVAPPYEVSLVSTQPDFSDIAMVVEKFVGAPTALSKVYIQLVPNVVLPERAVNFKDIAADVTAFLGTPFVDLHEITGPCTCPSGAVCGATPCASDTECSGGFCIEGFCTDACGRCSP